MSPVEVLQHNSTVQDDHRTNSGRHPLLQETCVKVSNSSGRRYFCDVKIAVSPRDFQQKCRYYYAYGGPSRPGHSLKTRQGVLNLLSNDSTRCRKACIFTPQAA